MTLHREIALEDSICAHLAENGWLHDPGAARNHDRARALLPDDLIAWIRETQPQTWESLTTVHGPASAAILLDRLRATLDRQGTLPTLRNGLEIVGLRQPITLCQFRPAFGTNAELQQRYTANRLRVIRQVRYTPSNENSLDLVLYLNGIPVATAELKSDYTQSVADAVDQYRHDRVPRSAAEPMLGFPGGPLVHFAVSNSDVRMCTRLEGSASVFLPFNKGHDQGAGNPPNPNGAPTAYLWEDVWQRDSWLDIIGRYVVAVRDDKKRLRGWIFPRFHQLDATRKLVAQMRADGPGGRYLIQHSAGSGKTNSIAWTAHFLADLHDAADRKLFDTVLVVSDRTVLDRQLREAIEDFQRTSGVVAVVTGDGAAKSTELAQALADGKKIVVCTIQTFPHAIQEVRRLAATQGKHFVVIADEAHSSQTGRTATRLKNVLSQEEQAALADGGEFDIEDLLAAEMATRARRDAGISYVAFTATPKARTLELFGRRATPEGLPGAFHVYSMRQAIEEGFILDVLRYYTTYKRFFGLVKQIEADPDVPKKAAAKALGQFLELHPVNIEQVVQVIIEHFRLKVMHELGGRAKAMVVTGSRLAAVKYKQGFDRYIRDKGYTGIRALVAFSGTVQDPDLPGSSYTEVAMNDGLPERELPERFTGEDYRVLIVAEKYQTGFDQPLLQTMYVVKKLAGVQAVQTLSRLNRTAPGKTRTFVLDFRNEEEDIFKAFRPYYEATPMGENADPQKLNELHHKLLQPAIFTPGDVTDFAAVWFKARRDPSGQDHKQMNAVLDRCVDRFREHEEAEREEFRGLLTAFRNLYSFLSQILPYFDPELERLYAFARHLASKLPPPGDGTTFAIDDEVALKFFRLQQVSEGTIDLSQGEADPLKGPTDVGTGRQPDTEVALSTLVDQLNERFGTDFTDADQLFFDQVRATAERDEKVVEAAKANSEANFSAFFGRILDDLFIQRMEGNQDIFNRVMSDRQFRAAAQEHLAQEVYRRVRQSDATADVGGAA